MNQFIDRKGTNLNKKILEVDNVTRDESGEITLLEVRESRNDSVGLDEEGTKLNKENLNNIIGNMIIAEVSKYALTGTERAVLDAYELNIGSQVNTNAINLPTCGNRGTVITWSSSNGNIISPTGVVNRGTVDQTVTLTATVGNSGLGLTKTFNVTVLKLTDNERVALDIDGLSVPSSVTGNFILTTTGANGSAVSWSSSNTSRISISNGYATVTRGYADVTVILTATASCNNVTNTKTFNVKVLRRLDSERVASDIAELTVPSSVIEDFTLATTGANGSAISWSSSNTSRISISNGYATVTRGSTDANVILTATVSYGSASDTKTFLVEVKARANTQGTTSYRLSHRDISLYMFTNEAQTVDGVVVSANNGTGISVEVNNPNSDCLHIYPRNNNSMQVTIVVEEISTNMPAKDGTYDFEITIKNLAETTLGTEYITLVYA